MKKTVGKRGRAKALRSAVAVMLSGLLVLTGCQTQGVVNDDYVPLASTSDAPQVFNNAEGEVDYAYTQTLDDGTVVSSDRIDVSGMDFEISANEVAAPMASTLSASAMSVDTATGSAVDGDAMVGVLASAMGVTASPMAADSTLGGLTISGGTVNTDFTHAANEVVIKKSTRLSLSGSFTGTVKVEAGVEAWIVLNGVTITAKDASSPINLLKGSQAHIILADGTTNTLNANSQGCAALHCGDGSSLWIDDAVVNYDFSAKKHIDVLYGKVATDGVVTNLTDSSTSSVVVGDLLTKVTSTSANVGKLIAKGGKGAAAIGAGPKEVSGTMVFDGGYIEAYSWGGHKNNNGSGTNTDAAIGVGVTNAEGYNDNDSSGTGIGGGAGGGGATETVFNSGTIYAYGSYHGAGIGAGWSSAGTCNQQTGASAVTRNSNNCGNIYINGGYVFSQGYAHGNAFGGACGTKMTGMTCRITGGTLRPFSHTTRKDIGGESGYVVIDGGSITLSPGGTQSTKFMSSDNKAYSDTARKQEVVPVEVDLSAQTGAVDFDITNWTLLIDGKIWQYGAPSKFNAGKLTLWLPPTAKTQKVEVQLNYYDSNKGSEVLVEPLYREAGSTSSNVKRNVYFDMPYQGVFGDATIIDETLPTITNFPNELLVSGSIPTTVKALEKEYDGLPFKTNPITDLTITESISKDTRKLTDNDLVTYSYRLLNGNTFTDELTSSQMPSDTGLMAFAMNSTEYAQGEWGKSYIGHRSTGYVRIKPVPAILTLEGAEWGYLDMDNGNWTPVTDADAENAGNRIKVTMNLRSAIGTAVTCKTPTGAVQLYIGGKKFGTPIVIGKDAATEIPAASKWSTYTVTEGPTEESANTAAAIASAENRWTAHITYYMDPHQADGLLNPKKSIKTVSKSDEEASAMSDVMGGLMSLTTDGKAYAAYDDVDESKLAENEYKLSGEYLPDKNYVEGVEANPQNADATATIIIPVDTKTDITDSQGTKYEFEPVDPTTGGDTPIGSGGTTAPNTGGNTFKSSVTKSYSDFHKRDAEGNEIEMDHTFTLEVNSTSAMPMEWHSSNPAVADVVRDSDGNVVYDENGNPKVEVFSCGPVTLTMHQDGNAVYNEQTRIIEMNVIPDESLKPDTEARVLWRNLTHPGMPAAPGDEIEYTIVGSNLTDGSSWQGVNLGDNVAKGLTINPDTVSVLRDFTTPEDRDGLAPEDLDEFTFEPVKDAKVTTNSDGTSSVAANVDSIHGGQSSAVRFTVTVGDIPVDRASMEGEKPPTIPNQPTAEGSYGVKETEDLAPGENAGAPIPVTDTVIIGIDPKDPVRAAVLPRDPELTGENPDMTVSKTAKNLTRDTGITLPGDTVSYTITVSNTSKDACLHWPVIRDTVPKGLEPVAGSFKLTRVDSTEVTVGDEVFVPATHTVALYVDDLYANESTTLTFECKVSDNASQVENMASVMGTNPSDKWKGENPDAIDTQSDEPVVPDEEAAEEILGGTIEPTDPEDPDSKTKISDVTPGGPLDQAKKADPEDPTKPAASGDPEPILPGDIITKFGDKPDPKPQDIADEIDRIIKEKVAVDPKAEEVDIPVTIERFNPEDPDNPEIINVIVTVPIPPEAKAPATPDPVNPPAAGDPWTPDPSIPTEDYPWDGFDWEEYTEKEGIPQVHTEEPASPGTLLPTKDPKLTDDENGKAELETVKTAENLTNSDGKTYVGDRVRYTIKVSNSGEGTTWFDAVIRDDLPRGVEIDMATAKLTTALGQQVNVASDAYDPMTRRLAVNVGDIPGGTEAELTFECTVVDDARNEDIGNIAKAYGKLPSEMTPEELTGDRPEPGSAFKPGDEWFENNEPGLTTPEKTYPTESTRTEGVLPADQSPALQDAINNGNGLGARAVPNDLGTKVSDSAAKYLKLAQTGDPAVLSMIGLFVLVMGAALVLLIMDRRQRRHERDILS